ncbi:hypothetical protein C0995_012188, partial [Termitomyces sp. Mi166
MAFWGQPRTLESLRSSGGGGGGPRGPPQQHSVWLQGQITQTHWPQGQQQLWIELDYKQCLYVKNLGAVRDESCLYQAPEYSGGLGKGAAYRPPYSQDESTDEECYERPQHMRLYASAVTQPMLPAQVEYAQYMHSVDEALLQRLEWAGQPVSAMAAFLWDDLAIMVVEGLLDQIKLMRRQRVSMLEQIERIGKCKAPTFEEPMVEPKRARAPSQYNGLVVTQQKAAAASKSKGKIVPMLSDESDYDESLSEHEWELEEGESVVQRFQHMQYNKKLAAKKANKAKAEAALQHRAINDFSGCIPNGLGVKVWGLLDVEQLNSCFTGALSDCVYYSVHNNTIFVGADANRAAAFEYSSQQQAKMPASLVY